MHVPCVPRFWLALACAAFLAGCPTSGDGGDAVVDFGPRPDTGPIPGADTDHDGLCDTTEIRLGTDPTKADTDGDGFPDWHEAANRSDPVSPSEPPRDALIVLTESPSATLDQGSTVRVSGDGSTYFPDFLAGLANDPYDNTARDFYAGTEAVDASPRDNVGHIDVPTGQFQGVVGATQLFFVTHFAYGTVPTRACLRMYNYFLRVKTDTGLYVSSTKGYLLIAPSGVLALYAVADTLKPTSREAIAALKALGITPVMLTGDNQATATAIAHEAGIEEARGNLLPEDKLEAIKALQAEHGPTAMTGDGINDAPALAQADIGVAMGAAGTDTAMEAADVVVMNDDLRRIAETVQLSRSTHVVLWQNITLALGIKAVFLVLAVFGSATMWMAIFADMGASLLVVGNGLRLLKKGGKAV